jgi:hypothetical protein
MGRRSKNFSSEDYGVILAEDLRAAVRGQSSRF